MVPIKMDPELTCGRYGHERGSHAFFFSTSTTLLEYFPDTGSISLYREANICNCYYVFIGASPNHVVWQKKNRL